MGNLLQGTAIGNLGRDGEFALNKDKQVIGLRTSVATKDRLSDTTQWISVLIPGEKRARALKDMVKSGKAVFVQGPLRMTTFTRTDNTVGSGLSILANEFQFTGPAPRDNTAAGVSPDDIAAAMNVPESPGEVEPDAAR